MIPPLSTDEYTQLEENIVAEGIRDPLVVWEVPNGDMILLDGHNRFEIAAKHGGIPFEVRKMHFTGNDRERAKAWMLKNQLGRRNLSEWQKFDLAKELEDTKKDEAKGRQGTRTDIVPTLAPSDAGKTRDKMADMVGVSHGTYDKMKYIDQHGSPELNKRVRDGEVTTNAAYIQLKLKEAPKPETPKEQREAAQQRHDEVKSSPVVSIDDVKQDKKDREFLGYRILMDVRNALNQISALFIKVNEKEIDLSLLKSVERNSRVELQMQIDRTISNLSGLSKKIKEM